MKYLLPLLLSGLFLVTPLVAQTPVEQRSLVSVSSELEAESQIKDLSSIERVLLKKVTADESADYSLWSRNVYRTINDTLAQNSAFFYPRQSTNEQVNLFALLFNLIKEGKINAYRFDTKNTKLVDVEKIGIKEILSVYKIPYTESEGSSISVDPYNIPSNEILSYYVKENWFYNVPQGKGEIKVMAICPVLHQPENYDLDGSPILKRPLFWISMEEIAPYLSRSSASESIGVVNELNNISLYDYLASRYYVGDVYQIGNRNLAEYYKTPTAYTQEQQKVNAELSKIEARFKTFK